MAIIEVNNLGKKYYLGERMSQRSILDSLKTTAKMPYRLARTLFTGESSRREAFWALKDVSFKVEEGEVLGIIGRNGAGKSTLLKILSRIVAPTEGEVILNGRVGSLLEVGTGFHPELTGRENIFMNGSLLGMSHAEISKHFDEIVDFSGIDKFLDTPVKFYSSGMYTRLAFSVAAHLRTEILIVDEVLAVGDTEFQKKCLAKMDSVAKSGRTILFVSHNMNAIKSLCNECILLAGGKKVISGNASEIINNYLNKTDSFTAENLIPHAADAKAYIYKISVEDLNGKLISSIPTGTPWQVRLNIKVKDISGQLTVGIGLCHSMGETVNTSWAELENVTSGEYSVVFKQSDIIYAPQLYFFNLGLAHNNKNLQYCSYGQLLIEEDNSKLKLPSLHCGTTLNQMTFTYSKV